MSFPLRIRWSNCSFRNQLFLMLLLCTAIVTVVFTYAFIAFERHSARDQLSLEGKLLAAFLAKELQLPLYADHREELAKHSAELFTSQSVNGIRIWDAADNLLVDGRRFPEVWQNFPLTAAAKVITDNRNFSPEGQLLEEPSSPDQLTGRVELALSTTSITRELQHFSKAAIIIALSLWITVATISFLLLKQLTRTLSLLFTGIDKIAGGDLESRIEVTNNADMERAAATINSLANNLRLREEENHRLQLERVNCLRLELDEEKTRHMAKLIQTNRMTSLGLLVSGMAHEINNPNGTIKLAGEYLNRIWSDVEPLLREKAGEEGDFNIGGLPFSKTGDEIEAALDSISRSCVRIERVVQNLRGYSLGDRVAMRTDVDLNRVASSALAIVRAHSRQSAAHIATQLAPDLPLIHGNPFQLEQVITNLLQNALQALPPQEGRGVFLITAWQRHDNSVTLTVRDEGVGIPAEFLPHLCEPFFSTRINIGGSGLGLYIANFITTEHQGQLEFSSIPDSGTTVTLRLPVKRTDHVTAEEAE